MKKLNKALTGGIITLLFLSFNLNGFSQSSDTISSPYCDTELKQDQPLVNFNLLNTITLNPRSVSKRSTRGIIKFQLNFDSLPANIQVTNAKLRLYTIAASHPATSKQIAAHRITSVWSEFSASWDKRTSNNWSSNGGDFLPAATGTSNAMPPMNWIEIDVTTDLQEFRMDTSLNKGWIIKIHSEDNSGHSWTYATKEYLFGAFAPQLVISYGFFLPVEYKDFTAVQEADNVRLEWQTLKEINNDHFEIEKSINGVTWEPIGVINGNGNNISSVTYSFNDRIPVKGMNYYRLKQVDHNGEFNYSKIVSVNYEVEDQMTMHALKQHNALQISIATENEQDAIIQVTDMTGRTILSRPTHIEKGINNYNFEIGDVAPGIYIITVGSGDTLRSFKTYFK